MASASGDALDSVGAVRTLVSSILGSIENCNAFSRIAECIADGDAPDAARSAAAHGANRCFSHFFSEGLVFRQKRDEAGADEDESKAALVELDAWLRDALKRTFTALLSVALTGSAKLSGEGVEQLMILGQRAQEAKGASSLDGRLLHQLVDALLTRDEPAKSAAGVPSPAAVLVGQWVNRYEDVRVAFLKHLASVCGELRADAGGAAARRLAALSGAKRAAAAGTAMRAAAKALLLVRMGDGEEGGEVLVGSVRAGRAGRAFQDAWVQALHLPVGDGLRRRLLEALPEQAIPYMTSPLPLADLLMGAFCDGANGELSILALDAIFELITHHSLDCPNYYRSLYQLLQPEAAGHRLPGAALLHSEHRHSFLRLLDMSLASSAAPSYLVAAFLKRLAAAALSAPPHAALFATAVAYNALHRHPELCALVHEDAPPAGRKRRAGGAAGLEGARRKRAAAGEAAPKAYDAHAEEPRDANAAASQLVELAGLEQHYLHSVPRLVRLLQKPFKKTDARLGVAREYSRTTYASLFLHEISSYEMARADADADADADEDDNIDRSALLTADRAQRVQGPKRRGGGRRAKVIANTGRDVPMAIARPSSLFGSDAVGL